MRLLRPVYNSYRHPTPPALEALEITCNELCVLFECGFITTGIHGAQNWLPDQGYVPHPGIVPQRWAYGICNQIPARTSHRYVDL